jgi:V/A-type H+-transporting ATPase subunit E
MEELRSAEVLDKEIRSDSVKKSEKILSKAEESAKQLIEGVDSRVSTEKEKAEKISRGKIDSYEKNINASMPLEKQRYLVSYIHNSLINALNEYFENLGEDKRLEVIRRLAENAKSAVAEKNVDAVVVGFDLAKSEKMLKGVFGKNLSSCKKGEEILLAGEKIDGFNFREGIVLKSADSAVTCRLTLDEKINEILGEKSCLLAETLFGGRLPE